MRLVVIISLELSWVEEGREFSWRLSWDFQDFSEPKKTSFCKNLEFKNSFRTTGKSDIFQVHVNYQKNSWTNQGNQRIQYPLATTKIVTKPLYPLHHERNGKQKSWKELIHQSYHNMGESGWALVIFHACGVRALDCFCFYRKMTLRAFVIKI